LSHKIRNKAVVLLAVLVGINVALWRLTLILSARHSFSWAGSLNHASLLTASAAWLAYSFGLRHAVDADHISAIDNTTRNLMRKGQRPIAVGFFFSLGHSTIVIGLCVAIALFTGYIQHHLPIWKSIGGVAGTVISTAFLYLIGFVNLVALISVYSTYKRTRGMSVDGGDPTKVPEMELRGFLGRIFKPIFGMINHSWQMYFVGFLFGLGFDTATEVGILAMSAKSGQAGATLWSIMLLPLLFTAGMCLIDTLNGVMMLGAYGWAAVQPARKLWYNLVITSASVAVAFFVGTAELFQILAAQPVFKGRFIHLSNILYPDNLGYIIIGLFLVIWAQSVLAFRVRRPRSAEQA